ncbi:MAG: STAS domain-containing protein [Firmicutes bacterium]|nr:STAS domain-containing protein [Bacillota bacterium]
MTITKTLEGSALTIALDGRLDTQTSPELEKVLESSLSSVESLKFDFTGLEYISSAGLRVLLSSQRQMNRRNGKMVVSNVNSNIMDVFQVTGFEDILTIE